MEKIQNLIDNLQLIGKFIHDGTITKEKLFHSLYPYTIEDTIVILQREMDSYKEDDITF
jgi:hypothetical protein